MPATRPDAEQVSAPAFEAQVHGDGLVLTLSGDWTGDGDLPGFEQIRDACQARAGDSRQAWQLAADPTLRWDSRLMARLFLLVRHCREEAIATDTSALPDNMRSLLDLTFAVDNRPEPEPSPPGLLDSLAAAGRGIRRHVLLFISFLGELVIALARFATGRSQTRLRDLFYFSDLCGPRALAIVSLISVLVGMILAYLGSVQLRQFGAEVYVANLVALGMVREMAPLMTAVIMAGRTGAAYAAQLGTMQANEEIDAVTTLGLSAMEYLVVPRFLALVMVMPLLVIFANLIGIAGGALVAVGMDVSFTQFFNQARGAVDMGDIISGLIKSLVFAALIAIAGCQSGLQSSRSSAGVGSATTRAVVHATVYLVVADAGRNILYDFLGV